MSEKLSAFAALYAEKAAADIENKKANVAKSEEKLNRAIELWNNLKADCDKLGISNAFISVFPQAGGGVMATDGIAVNPNFTNLLSYADPVGSSARELSKLKNTKLRLENSKADLASSEELAARKPEDHINLLGQELVKVAARTASTGGNTIDSIFKSVFNDYEGFAEIMQYEANGVAGPSLVNTSKEAYSVLKEKLESGTLFSSSKNEEKKESPINESSTASGTNSTVVKSSINSDEVLSGGTTEKTTGESATVTEGKPEVAKVESPPAASTNINLNLEKKEETTQLGTPAPTSPTLIGPINEPSTATTVKVEVPAPSVTQQNINLSESTQTNVSSPTTNATQGVSETVNTQNTSSSSTINQSTLEAKGEGPKFLNKVKAAAGRALSPIGESLMSGGKDLLGVAGSQLEKMGVPINLLNKLPEAIRENREERREKKTGVSAINPSIENVTQSTTNVENKEITTASNTNLTQNAPSVQMESNVEKSNPTVNGNPTTAQVENKQTTTVVNAPAPQTTSQAPTMAEVKPQTIAPSMSSPSPAPAPSTMIDVVSLENRLKRIELALTNPLEVIIKEA